MKTYVALFLVATLVSFLLTPLVGSLAKRWGVVAHPDPKHRIHDRPIPRLGGVAIFLAFLVTVSIIPLFHNLVAEEFRLHTDQVIRLLIPCSLILLLGIYDDFCGADARIKFAVQITASLWIYAFGLRIAHFWNPFGGMVDLGFLSLPLTLLWLVGITNAFNLIDGLDGLSAGAALFATLTVLVAALFYGHPLVVMMSIALGGATLGFLRYNFAPATVIMGDSGSLFLGFTLAALSLEGSQKSATAIAVAIPIVSLGLPILDTAWAVARRLMSKKPIFTGDREHIHHMILRRGFSIRQAVILLYGVCALFALFGLLFINPQGRVMGLVLFIIGFCVFLGIQHLDYHELREIRYALGRLFGNPQLLAANINIRRAASNLSEVTNLECLLGTLEEMLAACDFDRVEFRLPLFVADCESKLTGDRAVSGSPLSRLRLEPDGLLWRWDRPGTTSDEMLEQGRSWRLTVPLATHDGLLLGEISFLRGLDNPATMVDLHHVCTYLHLELCRAIERIYPARWRPAMTSRGQAASLSGD